MRTTAVQLSGLSWNPAVEFTHLLVISLSSGQLQLLEVKNDVKVVHAKPGIAANASECDGWYSYC